MQASAARGVDAAWAAAPGQVVARPIALKPAHSFRFMARVGVSMLWHDKLKLAGTLVGVAFAVLMSNFQVSLFLGLLLRNTRYVDRVEADVWITPKNTQILEGNDGTVPRNVVPVARSVKGVGWSAPILMGAAGLKLPGGGQKSVRLVERSFRRREGGPSTSWPGRPKTSPCPTACSSRTRGGRRSAA